MTEIVAVANPRAAGGKAKRYANRLHRFLSSNDLMVSLRFTRGPADATRITREAIAEGAEVVLAIGGDGTLNEVVNGFFPSQRDGPSRTALAIAPIGTGADFAKTVGHGSSPPEVLDRLRRSRRRAIDVGLVEHPDLKGRPSSRYFVNIAEFGSGAAVVEKVNRSWKLLGGRMTFLLAILSTMPKYRNTRAEFRLADGTTGDGVMNTFVVANGRHFGTNLLPAPNAEIDDGLFDVVIIGDIDWAYVKKHLKDLRRGTHLGLKEVTFHRTPDLVTVSKERAYLELDGELVGYDPTRFTCIPRAIDLLV
ncbi:MAG TPA: diacylglycerol kinase family protein [Thermoplasmata archaeon]|jgi:YegS/Rv2252/BmrU family lipid kinase|nr:diacylglycerol kinase family protein [Thermoplasmata archaeon]